MGGAPGETGMLLHTLHPSHSPQGWAKFSVHKSIPPRVSHLLLHGAETTQHKISSVNHRHVSYAGESENQAAGHQDGLGPGENVLHGG